MITTEMHLRENASEFCTCIFLFAAIYKNIVL